MQKGSLVAFQTEEPGTFVLRFSLGNPDQEEAAGYPFQIALGIEVCDRMLCVRDIDDLCAWVGDCPEHQ